MDAIHKQLRHMKRLKVVLKQPLKRSKSATGQKNTTVTVKCMHCQVEKIDAETQAFDTCNQEASSNCHVEKSDVEIQVSHSTSSNIPSTDAAVQVNITPTKIPRFIGRKFNTDTDSFTSLLSIHHAACQTEEQTISSENCFNSHSTISRRPFWEVTNDNGQADHFNVDKERHGSSIILKRNKTLHNDSKMLNYNEREDLKCYLNYNKEEEREIKVEEHLDVEEKQSFHKIESECREDGEHTFNVQNSSSVGIRNQTKNFSSSPASGIPVYNGWCRRNGASDTFQYHRQSNIRRKSSSAKVDLTASSSEETAPIQNVKRSTGTNVSQDLNGLARQRRGSAPGRGADVSGDRGAAYASKIPRPASQRSLHAPAYGRAHENSPRPRSAVSLQ